MFLYDAVLVHGDNVGACRRCLYLDVEVEVRFQAFVGRTYAPQMFLLRVGDDILDFPRIRHLDVRAAWRCATCEQDNLARVHIERGTLTWVAPFETDLPWFGLPLPRLRAKRERQLAACAEKARRALHLHMNEAAMQTIHGGTR